MFELPVKFGSQKSFGGKAKVDITGDGFKLFSYDTHVMTIKDGLIAWVTDNENYLSNTTLRHIREFLQQRGMEPLTKKQLMKVGEELKEREMSELMKKLRYVNNGNLEYADFSEEVYVNLKDDASETFDKPVELLMVDKYGDMNRTEVYEVVGESVEILVVYCNLVKFAQIYYFVASDPHPNEKGVK